VDVAQVAGLPAVEVAVEPDAEVRFDLFKTDARIKG
jgi:hypothetical protein